MIRSMTGFGKAEADDNGTKITVEIHTVNSRFLDIKMKLPRMLYEHEDELRRITQRYIGRGRVSLAVSVEQAGARPNAMTVDFELAERYVRIAGELAERCDVSTSLDARTLMGMPDVLKFSDNGEDAPRIWEMTSETTEKALKSLRSMREKEGEIIGHDIAGRLEAVRGHMDDIRSRAPEAVDKNTAALRRKIEQLLDNAKIDETRFATEVSIYADRVDVTEECVRFASHCDVFAREITSDKASGKKLSFLLQEMNREVNTLGSKANDAGISQVAVRIKEELEKMREQAENME